MKPSPLSGPGFLSEDRKSLPASPRLECRDSMEGLEKIFPSESISNISLLLGAYKKTFLGQDTETPRYSTRSSRGHLRATFRISIVQRNLRDAMRLMIRIFLIFFVFQLWWLNHNRHPRGDRAG